MIKVEPPKGGDDARALRAVRQRQVDLLRLGHRGKRASPSTSKADADRAIFEKLFAKADVIVENFRPGTMEKLGYGWETLHKKYPSSSTPRHRVSVHRPQPGPGLYDMVTTGHGRHHEHHRQRGPAAVARVGMSIRATSASASTPPSQSMPPLVHRLQDRRESTKVDIGIA